jgi:cell division protein FtsN
VVVGSYNDRAEAERVRGALEAAGKSASITAR